MAGHSKWHNIRHAKAAHDNMRQNVILKIYREIVAAVKLGGSKDPKENPKLQQAIDRARLESVPKSRVMSAIRVGSGEAGAGGCVTVLEVTGADGVGMLVETQSDNPRGNIPDVKKILNKAMLIMSKEGSAMWLFDKRGVVGIPLPDESVDPEILAVEVGAEEIREDPDDDDNIQLLCAPDELFAVQTAVKNQGIEVKYANLDYLPKSFVTPQSENLGMLKKAVEQLQERGDIVRISVNVDPALLES